MRGQKKIILPVGEVCDFSANVVMVTVDSVCDAAVVFPLVLAGLLSVVDVCWTVWRSKKKTKMSIRFYLFLLILFAVCQWRI